MTERPIRLTVALLFALFTLSACASSPRVEMRAASAEPVSGWKQMTPRGGDESLWVTGQSFITNPDIERAEKSADNLGRGAVMLEFNESGRQKMYAHSSANIGQPVAVLVDGQLICAPRLMSALRDRGMIVGLSKSEIDRMVRAFQKPSQ